MKIALIGLGDQEILKHLYTVQVEQTSCPTCPLRGHKS